MLESGVGKKRAKMFYCWNLLSHVSRHKLTATSTPEKPSCDSWIKDWSLFSCFPLLHLIELTSCKVLGNSSFNYSCGEELWRRPATLAIEESAVRLSNCDWFFMGISSNRAAIDSRGKIVSFRDAITWLDDSLWRGCVCCGSSNKRVNE